MSWKLYSSNLAWKFLHPVKNCQAVFAPRGFLDELLSKFHIWIWEVLWSSYLSNPTGAFHTPDMTGP